MEHQITVKEFAVEQGVHHKTIQRWIAKGQESPEWCELVKISADDSFPPSAILPSRVYWYLKRANGSPEAPFKPIWAFPDGGLMTKNEPGAGEAILRPFENGEHRTGDPDNRRFVTNIDWTESYKAVRQLGEVLSSVRNNMSEEELEEFDQLSDDQKQPDRSKDKLEQPGPPVSTVEHEPDKLSDRILNGDLFPVISMAILILADCVSFGWIAWNTFQEFQIPAAVFFSAAGFAVAYSSIKNAVSYSGTEGDAWLVGFGLLQFGLHMAAMGMFGSWSWIIGKAVISISIPMATIGIAITYKRNQK